MGIEFVAGIPFAFEILSHITCTHKHGPESAPLLSQLSIARRNTCAYKGYFVIMIIFVSVYLIAVWLRNFQPNQMHDSNRIAALLMQPESLSPCVCASCSLPDVAFWTVRT